MTIIDINMPKYEGSSDVGNSPVLCINNVNEKDEDVYRIDVINEWGTTTRISNRLKVIGSKNSLYFFYRISDEIINVFLLKSVAFKITIYQHNDIYDGQSKNT